MHEPEDPDGACSARAAAARYDSDDFKTLVQIGEDLGVGLKLVDSGRITLA